MDTVGVIQIIILFILLALSAYYSSAETALTTVNKVRMEALQDEGDKRASTVLKLLSDRSKMLGAILIMNNIINLSASALTTTLAMKYLGNGYVAIATGVLTFFILIFGEITPKSVATLKNESLALSYSKSIYAVMKILTPINYIIDKISNIIISLFGVDPSESRAAITEYELRSIVDTSHEDGVIETEEKEMINNVVDFGDSCAKDVMIPRLHMTAIPVEATFEEIKEIFFDKKYTRLPVYENTTDNIVGVLNMKDILFYENHEGFNVSSLMRKPQFTFEYKKTSDLLIEMRQNSISIIFVLDEYGATVGLITLEDLLEEIVGEIRDEYDDDEREQIKKVGDNDYIIEASMKLDDINDAIETDFNSEEYDSIGGLVIEKLEHIPAKGETAILDDGTEITVIKMDKTHIEKVKVELPDIKAELEEEKEEDV